MIKIIIVDDSSTSRITLEKLKQIEHNRRNSEFDRLFNRFYLAEYGRLEIAIVIIFIY